MSKFRKIAADQALVWLLAAAAASAVFAVVVGLSFVVKPEDSALVKLDELNMHPEHSKAELAAEKAKEERDLNPELASPSDAHSASPSPASGAGSGLPAASIQEPVHWDYRGSAGPEHWGSLDPSFGACRIGREQSPIDLAPDRKDRDLMELKFSAAKVGGRLIHDGRQVYLDVRTGEQHVEVFKRKRLTLRKIILHAPSEHHVGGARYEMEVQLSYQDAEGKQMYVGIPAAEGAEFHAGLERLLSKVPQAKALPEDIKDVNVLDLLPKDRSYFHYAGSLTVPPCTEGVEWFVFSNPLKIGTKQTDHLVKLLQFNARPIQPVGARIVAKSWK